jgi:DNA-binding SARP family transcriptional activator/tetratricopeptide (TPR) repeat protein
MRIQLFGSISAVDPDGREVSLGGPKQRTVLAMLCIEPGKPVSTDRLISAVWGDSVPERAARSLSTYLSNLRREIGDAVESAGGSHTLRLDRSQIDVCAFIDAVDSAENADNYREALTLWSGAPFEGLDGFGAFRDDIQHLGELRLVAERAVIETNLAAGEAVAAIPRMDALVQEFPFDEGLRGLHMRTLYGAGRQVEALDSFNSYKSQLAEELGLDPSPQLQDLELQILQQDDTLDGTRQDVKPASSEKSSRVPFPGFLARGLSDALIGRGNALEVLDAAYGSATDGTRIIAVVGEPGIGKTSLTATWAQQNVDSCAMVVAGRCTPDAGLPYQPFIEIAKAVLKAQPDRIRIVGPAAGNLALLVPGVGNPEHLAAPIQADPDTVEYLMAEAFAVLLEPSPGDAATIAILEDLHWADTQSIAVLGHLVRRTDDMPLLIIANYRDTDLVASHPLPGLLTDLRREQRLSRLLLDRLSDDQVREMISAHFGIDASDSVTSSISEETRGNPFFVEELTRHLQDEDAVNEKGRWISEIPIEEYGIPEGLRDVIGRRIARLGDDAMALLKVAAVIGPVFSIDMAGTIAGLDEYQIDAVADAATAASTIDEDDDTGDFAFAHALVRQTLYDELSTRRRIRLHRAVGEAIENSGGEPENALRHWMAANQPDRALAAAIAAAETTRSIAANLEARRHLELALDLWNEVDDPESITGLTHARLILLVEPSYARTSGERQAGLDLVSAELESTVDLDDATIGRLHNDIALLLWSPGSTAEQTEHHKLAMDLVPSDPPSIDRATVVANYAAHLMVTGFPEEAISIGREALEMARAVGAERAEGYALTAIASSLGQLGEVQAADQCFDELRLLAERTGNVRTRLIGYVNQGDMHRVVGDLEKALKMGDDGASLAAEIGVIDQEKFLRANAAQVAFELGRWDEAVRRIELLSVHPLIDRAEMNRILVSVVLGAERGTSDILDDERRRLEEFDLAADKPLISGYIWSAFISDWTWRRDFAGGFDLSTIAIDVHERFRDWSTSMWLAAYSIELIADGIAAGVGDDSWLELAQRWYDRFIEKNPAARGAAALQATSAADLARAKRDNSPARWQDAIGAWDNGSYGQAKARWRLAEALIQTDASNPDIESNLDLAQDVAEGLGAQPLLSAIERTRTGATNN